jgi:predicted RecA/RadA family phage recombinase
MKNYVSKGKTVSVTAPANVASGEYVSIGSLGGVAAGDAANGADLDLTCEGVFDIQKRASNVFVTGQRVFYSPSAKLAISATDEDSNSAADEVLIGVAVAAAGAGATSVRTRLTQPVVAA